MKRSAFKRSGSRILFRTRLDQGDAVSILQRAGMAGVDAQRGKSSITFSDVHTAMDAARILRADDDRYDPEAEGERAARRDNEAAASRDRDAAAGSPCSDDGVDQ